MQQQPGQNMYNPTPGNNLGVGGTGVRTNQQQAPIYRGPAPNTMPRNNTGTRHMPNNASIPTIYPQTMAQNMMIQNFTAYQPRQPSGFPAHQFTFQQPLPHYYPIQYFHTTPLQQAQTHQRSAVGVTTNAGVGNAMTTGPNGPMAGPTAGPPQTQVPIPAGTVISSAVPPLSVANPNAPGQVGVGVGVSPMVAVVPNVQTQAPQKKRIHAIPIINPVTNRNILEEEPYLSKRSSNSESEYQEPVPASASVTMQPDTSLPYNLEMQQQTQKPEFANISGIGNVIVMSPADAASRTNLVQHTSNIDLHHIPQHREIGQIGQTPIVSAMSDAPSVEILPSQPKSRSKKIPIVAPKEDASNGPKAEVHKENVPRNTEALPAEQQQQPAELTTFQQQQQQPEEHKIESSCNATTATSISPVSIISSSVEESNAAAEHENLTSSIQRENETHQTEIESNKLVVETQTTATSTTTTTEQQLKLVIANDKMAMPSNIVENANNNSGNLETNRAETNKNDVETTTTTTTTQKTNDNDNGKNDVSVSSKIDTAAAAAAAAASAVTITNTTSNNNNNNVKKLSPPPVDSNDIQNRNIEKQETQKTTATCDETDRALNIETTTTTTTPVTLNRRNSLEKSNVEQQESSNALTSEINEENSNSNHAADNAEDDDQASDEAAATQTAENLIQYNEGQWSPNNPSGKKQYDRDQLLQLREAKASRVQPVVSNPAILPQCNMMPRFANTNNNNKRMQSMGNMGSGGGHRGGDGTGSGSGNYGSKQSSMSGVNARGSSKGALIHINLSLNQDVKLNETDNAWRPRVLQKGEVDTEVDNEKENADLVRRVRGILNKLTPENFDALVEEIIKLKIDNSRKMQSVMELVFEKAVDEPNFAVSYARLCYRLNAEVKAGEEKGKTVLFRNALLDKTESEFMNNVTKNNAKETKLKPIMKKIQECTDPDEKAELEAQLEDEERKVRRRSTGTVRFIGELFKISMLTGKIIYSCIEQLLNPQSEDMLECLCKLLTTVGAKLEQTPVSAREPTKFYSLEKVIQRMQGIASKNDKDAQNITSRVRFMLLDVVDLRKKQWKSKRNEAPKTMGEIEKEAKSEQLSSQFLNYSGSLSTGPSSGVGGGNNSGGHMGGGGGGGGKRGGDDRGGRYNDHRSGGGGGYSGSHSQRGGDSGRRQNMASNSGNSNSGNSGNDDNWQVQTGRGRSLYVDSNKLEVLMNINQDIGTKKMGGMAQFVWTSRPTASSSTSATAPSNSFAALSALDDRNSDRDRDNDRDRNRDRDRSGPRNKGSYNKNSMERDRRDKDYWNDRNIRSRTGSSQVSRENSSSRGGPQSGGVRSMNAPSAVSKSASHSSSKYTQPPLSSITPNRMSGKPTSGFGASDSIQKTASSNISDMQSNSTTGPAVFEEPSDADIKIMSSVVNEIVEIIITSRGLEKPIAEAANCCLERIKNNKICVFLYFILTEYLQTRHVGPSYRRYLGQTICYLIEHKNFSIEHFTVAYEKFAEIATDLLIDIPELWLYIFQFTGPLISQKIITVHDLWTERLKQETSSLGKQFLKAFLNYCTRGIGPSFTRNIWTKQKLKWTDFMSEKDVGDFIQKNNLEYIEDNNLKPRIEVRIDFKESHINQVVDHIQHLLYEGANADSIIDYINGNIVDIDKQFVRQLTTTLCQFCIAGQDGNSKLNVDSFQKICVPVLQRYIEVVEEREYECLYAMQKLVHELEHPRGLLCEIFAQLYDADVISSESFLKWRNANDQSAGKGVAVKGLNSFFNQLLKEETSDENN